MAYGTTADGGANNGAAPVAQELYVPPSPSMLAQAESDGRGRFAVLARIGAAGMVVATLAVAGRLSVATSYRGDAGAQLQQSDASDASAPPRASPSSSASSAGYGSIYKRTHMSLNASADGAFIEANLGPTASYYKTTDSDSRSATDVGGYPACVHRAQFMGSGLMTNLIMHYVTDYFFHEGNTSASEWVDAKVDLHGDLNNFAGWDKYMSDSVAYFVPTLDMFMSAWMGGSTAFIGYNYTNPVCGSTMYMAMITVPNTGDMIEVHSGTVSDEYSSYFETSLEDVENSCAESYFPTDSLETMTASWDAEDEDTDDEDASKTFPKVLPFRMNVPAANFSYVERLTGSWSGIVGSMDGYKTSSTSTGCTYKESTQDTFQSNLTITLRVVDNSDAIDGGPGFTLAEYETYVKGVRETYMGFDHGWDRYIDNHIGWYLPIDNDNRDGDDDDHELYEEFKLDTIARIFENGVDTTHYKGHYSGVESTNAGSLWTDFFVGGSVGVEFAGNYDWTYFNTTDTTELSFCDADSVGSPAKNQM